MTPHGNKLKGLKISHFNRCMIVISCILYVLLLRATVVVSRNYEQLVGATREYIRLENAATDILKASDYLTEQARLYAQTLDPKHAQLYFEEANVIRRRESALARMAPYSSDKDYLSSLTTAAQHSNELMVREVYAMKLIAVAEGHPEAELPAEVNAVCLEQDDLVLSRQEKLEKARSLLFDAEYQLTKSIIYDHLDLFTQKVMLMTKDNLTDGLDYLSQSIHTHRMLLSILIGLNLVTFFVITLLVVKPLKIFLECIQSQTLFHPTGAYEFKYLAHMYNDIYQRSDSLAASEAHLRQKAEHDGLTGILNRYMFQKVCALLSDSTAPLALVLIDVDKFKNINDTYGHTAGDQVLIRVAQTLKDNLRGSDYVFRIGGDEFAAILPEVTGDNVVAVCNKLLRINEGLQTPDGTVPGVSLSIGITLSEHGYHDALYKQADTALYWIKKHGRCGCMVYKEELENNQ